MRNPNNNDLPSLIEAVTAKLRRNGFISDAERLHELIHELAWTTSTELLGELRMALESIGKQRTDLPPDLFADIRCAVDVTGKILGGR